MQMVQYTSNKFQDSNKYTNRLGTYKDVTKHIYLQLWIILGNQCSFLCELEVNSQRNLIQSVFISKMSPYPYPQHFYRTLLYLDLYPSIDRRKLKIVDAKY
jgi:hypothetical protein